MKRVGYGILSIFLHLSLAAGILLVVSPQPLISSQPLVFELQEKAPALETEPAKISQLQSALAPHKISHKDPPLVFKNLFAGSAAELAQKRARLSDGFESPPSHEIFKDEESFKTSSADVFGDNSYAYFYKAIFERIDSHLILPSKFAQYDHLGKVFVLFEVTPEGELLGSSLHVNSNDAILKVYILRALRLALAKPLPRAQEFKSAQNTQFKAQFTFSRQSSRLNLEKQKIFTKPILNFARYTSEKAIATTLAEQMSPRGANPKDLLNPFYIYESWKNYADRQKKRGEDFDPFQEYRNDPDYNL